MKAFVVSYHWFGDSGSFEEVNYVVIAEDEAKAIKLTCKKDPDVPENGWKAKEIDTTKAEAHWIMSTVSSLCRSR